jgi:geranylgeranyl diphosphate synthase, type I
MLDFLQEQAENINRDMERLLPRSLTHEWVQSVLGRSTYDVDLETLSEALSDPVWDFLDRGGKRWRPVLLVTSAEAVGGDPEIASPLIPMIEFIHNGTLVHDDLEDDSELRRGKPCLHKSFGVDIATNVGSAMYFIPMVILYGKHAPYSDAQRLHIYDLVIQELVRCHCGQGIDIAWHNDPDRTISEGEYLQMCAYKTGVLARLAAKLGAYVAGGDEKQVEELGRFGETLGVSFQIQDDILNLTGTEFAKGKGRGEDIHEGKLTLLVLHTIANAPESDALRLRQILASHPTDQSIIDEAIEIIERNGAIDYAHQRAGDLIEAAWSGIETLLADSPAKARLREFATFVTDREL